MKELYVGIVKLMRITCAEALTARRRLTGNISMGIGISMTARLENHAQMGNRGACMNRPQADGLIDQDRNITVHCASTAKSSWNRAGIDGKKFACSIHTP